MITIKNMQTLNRTNEQPNNQLNNETNSFIDFLTSLKINLKNHEYPLLILSVIHFTIPYLVITILLFTNDIINLIILLFILKLVLVANYKCGDCPISDIETNKANNKSRYYIDMIYEYTTTNKNRKRSDATLEWLWIAIMLTMFKIFGVIVYKMIKRSVNNIKCTV